MQTKVNPALIGLAAVLVIGFCVWMYLRANSMQSPQQLPPPGPTYNPGYTSPSVDSRHHNGAAPAGPPQGTPAGASGH